MTIHECLMKATQDDARRAGERGRLLREARRARRARRQRADGVIQDSDRGDDRGEPGDVGALMEFPTTTARIKESR